MFDWIFNPIFIITFVITFIFSVITAINMHLEKIIKERDKKEIIDSIKEEINKKDK